MALDKLKLVGESRVSSFGGTIRICYTSRLLRLELLSDSMGAVLWKIQLYYNHRHLLYHSRNIKPDALSQFSSPRISLILRRPLPIMTLSSLLHVWWLQFRPSQGNTGILTTVDRVFKTAFCGSFQTPFSSRGRRPARELIVSASWLSCGHCFRPSPCGRLSVRCLWHR